LPGVGFAMGDVVAGLVLEKYGKLPQLPTSPTQVLVTIFGEALVPQARQLASELRQAGLRVELYPEPAKLNKQLKYADQHHIPFAAIIGPDEAAAGTVALRDLLATQQQIVARTDVAATIKQTLKV
jgi:histidyl-tRNA synthetase